MRILVRTHLWRAFPELDPFSDDQCLRFVRAAYGSRTRRLVLTVVCIAGALLILALASAAVSRLLLVAPAPPNRPSWLTHPAAAGTIASFLLAIAPLTAFILRDLLLRRRVRIVLRTRGSCIGCGYFLGGLAVSPDFQVTCPECGERTGVDPSLSELAPAGAGGAARFAPAPTTLAVPHNRWWTPAVARGFRRWTLRAGAAAAALALAGLAIHEVTLRVQAARAAADRPTAADWQGVLATLSPAAPSDPAAPGRSALIRDLITELEALHASVKTHWFPVAAFGRPALVRPRVVNTIHYGAFQIDPTAADRVLDWTNRRRIERAALNHLRGAGFFERLDRLPAARPDSDWTPDPRESVLFAITRATELDKKERLRRILIARAVVAWEHDDPADFERAIAGLHAIREARIRHPGPSSVTLALRGELEVGELFASILAARPDTRWLDAIERADLMAPALPPKSYVLRVARFGTLDFNAWLFQRPSRVRFGVRGELRERLTPYRWPLPPGGFAPSRAIIRRAFDDAIAVADLPPAQRPPLPPLPAELPVAMLWGHPPELQLRSLDRLYAAFDRLPLLLALERYRQRTGAYPSTLDRLPPGVVPRSPITGGPLVYEPASDAYTLALQPRVRGEFPRGSVINPPFGSPSRFSRERLGIAGPRPPAGPAPPAPVRPGPPPSPPAAP